MAQAYWNDVPVSKSTPVSTLYIQAATEMGAVAPDPTCPTGSFCPGNNISRWRAAYYIVNGVFGKGGGPQPGVNYNLHPVNGPACSPTDAAQYQNTIWLVDSAHFTAIASTTALVTDPSLWSVSIASEKIERSQSLVPWTPTTVTALPQPATNNTTVSVQYPPSGAAPLTAGYYLQTVQHGVLGGPCGVSNVNPNAFANASPTTYSFPNNGTGQYLPASISATNGVSPNGAAVGTATLIMISGVGLDGATHCPGGTLGCARIPLPW